MPKFHGCHALTPWMPMAHGCVRCEAIVKVLGVRDSSFLDCSCWKTLIDCSYNGYNTLMFISPYVIHIIVQPCECHHVSMTLDPLGSIGKYVLWCSNHTVYTYTWWLYLFQLYDGIANTRLVARNISFSSQWMINDHKIITYPLVNIQKAIENGPVEIVDLPINSMVDLSSSLCNSHYQAGYPFMVHAHDNPISGRIKITHHMVRWFRQSPQTSGVGARLRETRV